MGSSGFWRQSGDRKKEKRELKNDIIKKDRKKGLEKPKRGWGASQLLQQDLGGRWEMSLGRGARGSAPPTWDNGRASAPKGTRGASGEGGEVAPPSARPPGGFWVRERLRGRGGLWVRVPGRGEQRRAEASG